MPLPLISIFVFLGSFLLGLTGFGFGLVTMSTVPNFVTVTQSNVLTTSLAIPAVIANLIPIRKHVRFRVLWPIIVTGMVGVPVGLFLLIRLPEDVMRISLGVLILVTLSIEVFVAGNRVRTPSVPVALGAGLLSGALGGAFSVGGPPVTLYLSSILEDKRDLKANLLFYFLIIAVLRIPLFAAGGVITGQLLGAAGVLLIPLALGMVGGLILFHRVPSHIVRKTAQALLAVSAVLLIARSVW